MRAVPFILLMPFPACIEPCSCRRRQQRLTRVLVPAGLTSSNADGLFGTAVATMGMLSTAAYVLTMDVFGPISDNAGGIVEMSQQPESVRAITDLLVCSSVKVDTVGAHVRQEPKSHCFLVRHDTAAHKRQSHHTERSGVPGMPPVEAHQCALTSPTAVKASAK